MQLLFHCSLSIKIILDEGIMHVHRKGFSLLCAYGQLHASYVVVSSPASYSLSEVCPENKTCQYSTAWAQCCELADFVVKHPIVYHQEPPALINTTSYKSGLDCCNNDKYFPINGVIIFLLSLLLVSQQYFYQIRLFLIVMIFLTLITMFSNITIVYNTYMWSISLSGIPNLYFFGILHGVAIM